MLTHPIALSCLAIFGISYCVVLLEEYLHLSKSKPVLIAAGIIWVLIAHLGLSESSIAAESAFKAVFLEYSELFFFLVVAMTYINCMEERGVFTTIHAKMVKAGYSFKSLFWITGILAFFISPIADNLTTALLMGRIILALGKDHPKFIVPGCVNVVVAANAGGAFSPFGDLTTLIVWQKGILPFFDFFVLGIPCFISFLVPAFFLQFVIPKAQPEPQTTTTILKPGAGMIVFLFLATITCAVLFHHCYHLPPVLGMLFGLGGLMFYGYKLSTKKTPGHTHSDYVFNIFSHLQAIEWDTLLFLYGILICIGGLSTLGYLELLSHKIYLEWFVSLGAHGITVANTLIGVIGAFLGNLPMIYSVITMSPVMSEGQWLLITLTTGIGGSLLSIGSAAGIGLMGIAPSYTFWAHLRWIWAILLGYFASIAAHLIINAHLF